MTLFKLSSYIAHFTKIRRNRNTEGIKAQQEKKPDVRYMKIWSTSSFSIYKLATALLSLLHLLTYKQFDTLDFSFAFFILDRQK